MVNTAGGIVIAVVVILLAAAVGWFVFTQLRARRLGLPPPGLNDYLPWKQSTNSSFAGGPPRPAPGGIAGWFNDRVRAFKNRNNRSATGAYEQPLASGGAGPQRGFGPLDPDEAWDSRVGPEADRYYEERADTSYGGGSYSMNLAGPYGRDHDDDAEERGRSGRREGDRNPFDDDHEANSLRGVSPRPMDGAGGRGSVDTRRSAFREDV